MSVFREAFVELSEVAFAEAKALGEAFEAAIAEAARQRVVVQDALSERSCRPPDNVFKILVEMARPTARFLMVSVDPWTEQTLVNVKLACGHKGVTALDDRHIEILPTKVMICDYIIDRVQRAVHRRCYCVQQEAQ